MGKQHKWGMVIDLDRCTGCQACVIACQSENNVPVNEEVDFLSRRAKQWIRIERVWEGEWPNIKARFMPVLCQHCENAPCEPVCPVYATYHNNEGMNVQVYNRCIGTRYCANNCPYQVRFFNFFDPEYPDSLKNQLNPDVTIRSRGIMEKCTFCVQRIRRAERRIEGHAGEELSDQKLKDGNYMPACVSACPTDTLMFGDLNDQSSEVATKFHDRRNYKLLDNIGTEPNVVYLKKVDSHAEVGHG
ncbi:4Fe-4S dicluster domain-containing protein [SAR202 cluster bacterium AD-804-J14_MRT_500m]|nr:4Fe-4S dicluster domain-containing protein [SAR202 cluster bacterium AD-804-J14_MRT_500m]